MKALLPLLLVPIMAIAGEKDPQILSKEAAANAKKFFAEAQEIKARAAKASEKEAAELHKYAEWTMEEGKYLFKASEAWGKNQLRLAERYAKKAGEYCEKRGKVIEQIYPKCEDKAKCEDKDSDKLKTPDDAAGEKAEQKQKDPE